MGPSDTLECVNHHFIEKSLDEKEILLRRAFVQEYMKSRNAYGACIALGFLAPYAEDWATAFMGEGIVRRLIQEAEASEDTEAAIELRKKRYRAWMEKEANFYGPGSSHGARVTAIFNLMKIEGMEASVKTEAEVTYKGGVMMVPALTSPDKWGEMAQQSQAQLKDTVKE